MKAFKWILLLSSLLQSFSAAAPGEPDPDFGNAGRVTIDLGSSSFDSARDVAVQADGKIVVAGYTKLSTYFIFAAVRLNSNGSPDTSFSGDGKVTTPISGGDATCQAVTIQSDGKILLAGSHVPAGKTVPDVALIRYNTDGSLDTGFGTGGISVTPIRALTDTALDVAVQEDGKIVIAGYSSDSVTGVDAMLARFTSTGVLDTFFAGTGFVTRNYLTGYDQYSGVLLETDGAMTAVGSASGDWIVSRHHPVTGALDTRFSTDGRLNRPAGGTADVAGALAGQKDGKLVVAGYDGSSNIVLARYDETGVPDTDFGVGGRVMTDLGGNEAGNQVFAMEDKTLVVASTRGLLRYFTDGTRDLTWGSSGLAALPFSPTRSAAQADGKIVLVGFVSGGTSNFEIARFSAGAPPAGSPEISVRTLDNRDLQSGGTVDYGMAYVEGVLGSPFMIRNEGTADLTGLSVSIEGPDAGDFHVEELPSASVAPGGETSCMVAYKPHSIGAKSATVRISSNDADEAVFLISLTATAEGRGKIRLETPEGVFMPYGADLAMGNTPTGETREVKFIIRNTGSHPLTAPLTPAGPVFTLSSNAQMFEIEPAPLSSIPPGGSVEVTIRFSPTATDRESRFLYIGSNDLETGEFLLFLTGEEPTPEEGFDQAIESAGLEGDDAGPRAIPFGDGVENLLKYAFNMNLTGPDASTLTAGTGNSGLPAVGLTGTGEDMRIRVEFVRRKGSGLIYVPRRSSTLEPGSFSPMTATQSVSPINGDWERVVVEEPATASTLPSSFAYVKVELP